jgi:hypothetical protein
MGFSKEFEELVKLVESRAQYYNRFFLTLHKRKNATIKTIKDINNKFKKAVYENVFNEYGVNQLLIDLNKELFILEHIIGSKDDDHHTETKFLYYILDKIDDIKDFIISSNLYDETIFLLDYKDNFIDMTKKILNREMKIIKKAKSIKSIKSKENLIKLIKVLDLVIKTNEIEQSIVIQNSDFIVNLLMHMSKYLVRDINAIEVEFDDLYRDVRTLNTKEFTKPLMIKYNRFMDEWIKLNYNYLLISFMLGLFSIFSTNISRSKILVRNNLRLMHKFTIKINNKIKRMENFVEAEFGDKHYENIGRMVIYLIDLLEN